MGDQHSDDDNDNDARTEARRLLAELIGTFALVFVTAGADVIKAVGGEIDFAARLGAPGLVLMAMIYVLGPVSGAHLNPAVTLGFALHGDFPWRRVPGYWAMQIAGAVLAALLLRGLFGLARNVGATLPHHSVFASLIMETVLTFLLVLVILGVATDHRLIGHSAALAVGGTIAFGGWFAAPISGASMNPARSFGPALVDGRLGDYWIYVAGPFAGAVFAVAAAYLLFGRSNHAAKKMAK